MNEPVKYKVRHISNKMELLDREIKYLINKIKIWKPKQDPATNNQTDGGKTEETTENQEESPLDSAVGADTEKEKSAEEQTTSGDEQEQQRGVPVTDETLFVPEREEPISEKEEDPHQEL